MANLCLKLLVVLFLSTTAASTRVEAEQQCIITNVTHTDVTSYSVVVKWEVNQACKDAVIGPYKVYAVHKAFKACVDGAVGSDKSDNQVYETGGREVTVNKLQPYSAYEVEVVAQLAGDVSAHAKADFETRQGAPDTTPSRSSVQPSQLTQAIRFHWLPPKEKDSCRRQNGVLSGYAVELWGLDEWALSDEPEQTQMVSTSVEEVFLEKLRPFTRYKALVFTINEGRLYNRDAALKLTGRTSAVKPLPPTDVRLTPAQNSIRAHWRPAYPPTGKVTRYVVKVGVNNTGNVVWKKEHKVDSRLKCVSGEVGPTKPVCFVIPYLEPNTTYAVEVKTYNEGVREGSQFSDAVSATTDPGPATYPPSPAVDPTESASPPPARTPIAEQATDDGSTGGGGGNRTLMIIVGLVVAVIVLIAVCLALVYKIKMNKLQLMYERQSSIARLQQNSGSSAAESTSYLPATSDVTRDSYVQDWATQIQDIQSRRLPEPPPLQKGASAFSVSAPAIPTEDEEAAAASGGVGGNGYVDVSFDDGSTEDMGGYLRPTFLQSPEATSTPLRNPAGINAIIEAPVARGSASPEEEGSVIPPRSYVSPRTLQEECERAIGGDASTNRHGSNESHPLVLISNKAVNV